MVVDPKIKYDILANVTGDRDVNTLATALDKLDESIDPSLAGRAKVIADSLRNLGNQRDAIDRFVELKRGTQEAGAAMATAQTTAQQLAREIAATGAPTRAQTGQMEKLRDAVRSSKQAYQEQVIQLQAQRTALQRAGLDTGNLAQAQKTIQKELQTTLTYGQRLVEGYKQQATAAQASAGQQVRAHRQISDGVKSISQQLETLQNISIAGVLGSQAAQLVQGVAATADEFQNLSAKVKLVTGEGESFQAAMKGIYEVSRETSSALDATATLFTRIDKAGRELNLTQSQSLELTKTINQAIQLSGGSASSAEAAIIQLVQGLQSGVLRGEEFNSVMEQSPRLAQALADGLAAVSGQTKVTTGDLRKMAQDGQLTTETVIRALQTQRATLNNEFSQLPQTVGRALTNLRTEYSKFVADMDKSSGFTSVAAGAVDLLANNLDELATALRVVGELYAAKKIIDFSAGLRATVISAQEAAAANLRAASSATALTEATVASTVATTRDTQAKLANAQASQAAGAAAAAASVQIGAASAAKGRATLAATALTAGMGFLKAALPTVAFVALFEVVTRLYGAFRELRNQQEEYSKKAKEAAKATQELKAESEEFWKQLRQAEQQRTFERLKDDASATKSRLIEAQKAAADLGLELTRFGDGTSKAFNDVFTDLGVLTRGMKDLERQGVDTGSVVQRALSKLIDAASTEADFKRVTNAIKQVGVQAGLAKGDVDALLDSARQRSQLAADGILDAFRQAGIKTKAELQSVAKEQEGVYQKVKASGQATTEDLLKVFQTWADAAAKANNGVTPEVIKQEGALLKVKLAAEGAGEAIDRAMTGAANSTRSANSEFERSRQLLQQIYDQQVANASLPPSEIRNSAETFSEQVAAGEKQRQQDRIDQGRTPSAVDNTGLGSLLEKKRNGTLSAADLPVIQATFDALSQNLLMVQRAMPGTFSLEGARSVESDYVAAKNLLEQFGGSSASGSRSGISSKGRTIRLELGNTYDRTVNVASEQDADNLDNFLNRLQQDMKRAIR